MKRSLKGWILYNYWLEKYCQAITGSCPLVFRTPLAVPSDAQLLQLYAGVIAAKRLIVSLFKTQRTEEFPDITEANCLLLVQDLPVCRLKSRISIPSRQSFSAAQPHNHVRFSSHVPDSSDNECYKEVPLRRSCPPDDPH